MKNSVLHVTRVSTTDLEELQKLSTTTFLESFASENSEHSMAQYINDAFSHEKLAEELSNPESEFYFATQADEIIGYLKLNFGKAQTESLNPNSVEVERIYIRKEFQRNGAGQIMFNMVLQIANKKKASYIWLGVWEKNLKAVQFYKKNGFIDFGTHIFKLGDEEQIDLIMRLALKT